MLTTLAGWIARVGPCGLSPVAPGTVGAAAGAVAFYFLGPQTLVFHLVVIAVLFALGTWACQVEEKRLGKHDLGEFVIDEVVGFWITALAAPHGLFWLLLAFGLFRLFDIAKPFPIRLLDDKVGGGFGVMIDDVLAGVFGYVILFFLAKVPWLQEISYLFETR